MTDIGSYKVPIIVRSEPEEALVLLADEADMPTDWHFEWPRIFSKAKRERFTVVKLEYKQEVWGLVNYGIFDRQADGPDKSETFVLIENLEANPRSRGKRVDRLLEPIGKWLIWYCVKIGLERCSGNETLLFLISRPESAGYYLDKISMELRNAIRLEEGEVYAFGLSRPLALEYIQRQEREWGTPQGADERSS